MQNLSSPLGTTGWFQGTSDFPAYTAPDTSYIAADSRNVTGSGTISNWLLTPVLTIANGDTFNFWSRIRSDAVELPDRLELRLSKAGSSSNVGATANSVGDFTTLLLTINPTLVTGVYPKEWTKFTATISGLGPPATGRVGFRYYVTDGGPTGSNSSFIGIDGVQYCSSVSTPTNTPPIGSPTPTIGSPTPTATTTPPGNNRVYVPLIINAGASAAIQRLESASGADLMQQYRQISLQ